MTDQCDCYGFRFYTPHSRQTTFDIFKFSLKVAPTGHKKKMVIHFPLFVSFKLHCQAEFEYMESGLSIPIYPVPLLQNQSSCKTTLVKMSLICMKMNLSAKRIS